MREVPEGAYMSMFREMLAEIWLAHGDPIFHTSSTRAHKHYIINETRIQTLSGQVRGTWPPKSLWPEVEGHHQQLIILQLLKVILSSLLSPFWVSQHKAFLCPVICPSFIHQLAGHMSNLTPACQAVGTALLLAYKRTAWAQQNAMLFYFMDTRFMSWDACSFLLNKNSEEQSFRDSLQSYWPAHE